MDLDLCCACRRHVRATETTCPFCGATHAPATPAPPRETSAGPAPRSRAQRYVLGAAVAAGIGIAKASAAASPAASPDAGSDAMADASEPAEDAGTKPLQERDPYQREREREWERQQERHQGGGPCTSVGCCGGPVICPPYGCLFPDEACGIVHV